MELLAKEYLTIVEVDDTENIMFQAEIFTQNTYTKNYI